MRNFGRRHARARRPCYLPPPPSVSKSLLLAPLSAPSSSNHRHQPEITFRAGHLLERQSTVQRPKFSVCGRALLCVFPLNILVEKKRRAVRYRCASLCGSSFSVIRCWLQIKCILLRVLSDPQTSLRFPLSICTLVAHFPIFSDVFQFRVTF